MFMFVNKFIFFIRMKRTLKILTLMSLIFSSISVFAGIDREIQESKKCSSMFSYFENRYNLPKDILHSISLQETGKSHSRHKIGVVWPWTINVEGKGFHFKTKKEAIRFVKDQMAEGKSSIDVGCMQINLKYHPDAFTSLDQAFSPRQNIAYAAELLKDHYSRHGNWDKAIGQYHSGTEDRAKIYQASVSKISSKMAVYKQDLKRYSRGTDYRKFYLANSQGGMKSKYDQPLSRNEIRISRLKNNDLFRKIQQ
jgi:soluble lytic murein transglycosylase-like protein